MSRIRDIWDILWPNNDIKSMSKGFIAGAELEIEGVIEVVSGGYQHHCKITEDHSLRNGGREFITHPFSRDRLIEAFNWIHESKGVIYEQENKFSERTSTHVHVNITNLKLEQAKNMMLIYALFEPVFFTFVGESRKHNIYCVPLSHTFLPSKYCLDFPGLVQSWHKYTALNLAPAKKIGTMEFRHLYGTDDPVVFTNWIDILKALYDFVESNPNFDIKEAVEQPKKLFDKIFDKTALHELWGLTSNEELFNATLDVKMAFLEGDKTKYLPSKVKTRTVAIPSQPFADVVFQEVA